MPSRVGSVEAAKSVLNEVPPSRRERLATFDQDEQSVLGVTLARDPVFQLKAAIVAKADPRERQEVADREAEAYVPYRPHRLAIADLLLAAAAARDNYLSPLLPQHAVVNLRRTAVWVDDEQPDPQLPQRVRPRFPRLEVGALMVARFGAGLCIECGRGLASDRHGRERRRHCSPCTTRLRKDVRASQLEAMRDVIEAATGQRRKRRAARRR
jgi:hypothetical protein